MSLPTTWTLSDEILELRLDGERPGLTVIDKRCGKVWEQARFPDAWRVLDVTPEPNRLRLTLLGDVGFTATIELTAESEVVFSVSADAGAAMATLAFPPEFLTPDAGHALVLTDGEGLLLPAGDTNYPLGDGRTFFCGGGLAMAWMGVTDSALAGGYMAILETPFDAALEPRRSGGLVTFAPVWLSSMGAFGYERKIRYVFFARGGYVAQCKRYRDHVWPKNDVRTLRENQERFPAIEKILGAVHVYVWDQARTVDFARGLKAAGIERAFLLWNPNHAPYPEPGYDTRLHELGYASAGYELFTDVHPVDAEMRPLPDEKIFLKRNYFPGLFHALAAQNHDGGYYVNQFGHTINPVAVRAEIVKRVERELALYPHESYFLDVYQANGLFECHNPGFRLTRQQYAEAIIANCELLEDTYGTFLGAEWGADFAGSHGVYAHGMMTLQRTWFDTEVTHPGTIHYAGDWKNNARPTQMLGTRVAPEIYLEYSINETTRVPLYELVYHDAIVTSWRWEDCNHHTPEIWWKKDLFNVLYGTAPLWSIDQDRWADYAVTFVESYRKICPWLLEICRDEMVSHRFVSADRSVQETRFASGKRAVVNFGGTVREFEGHVVPPRGFLTLGTDERVFATPAP